jgi:uncharacterized membrane protein YphA (DoxX/SURF4 family)
MRLALAELAVAVRTLTALVFLLAAAGKMRHRAVFGGVVANYRLLPQFLVSPVAYALPPFEAILGFCLLLGLGSPWPEAAAAALLVVFAAAIGVNLRRGRRDIDCGCFQNALKQTLSFTLVMRNGALAMLLGLAAVGTAGSITLGARAEGLLVGGTLFIILQSLDTLWSIVPAWRLPRGTGPGIVP